GRGLEDADDPNTRVVDEHVDVPRGFDRGSDALGLRHVERQGSEPLSPGQNVFARCSHGGDHVPAMRVKVARSLEAIAGRASSNEHGLHVDSFLTATIWVT